MRYLAWLLMLFGAAVALVTLARNDGYVLLALPPYRIEFALSLFAGLLLLAGIAGYGLLRLLMATLSLPEYVRKYRQEQAGRRARDHLEAALGAYFEGRYGAAEKAASDALAHGEHHRLLPVIAARAAHALHAYEKRDAYLAAAEEQAPGDAVLHGMARAQFCLDQRDAQGALHALRQLRENGVRKHTGALALELKAQQLAGDWEAVLQALTKLEKQAAIDSTAAGQIRQQAWVARLQAAETEAALQACWHAMPAEIRRRAKVAGLAARAWAGFAGWTQAQAALTDSLEAQWDSELVGLLGDMVPSQREAEDGALACIERAEKWLVVHREDAALLLALGKLCLHQELWGRAESYLEASVAVAPSAGAYTALGQLAERLNQSAVAADYHLKAAALARAKGCA